MGSSASSRTAHHRAGHRPRPQHHGAGARHRRGPEPTGTSRPEHGAAAQVPRPEPLKRHQGQRIDRPFGQVEHRRQHPAVEPRADHGRSLRGPPLARPAHRDQHPRAVRATASNWTATPGPSGGAKRYRTAPAAPSGSRGRSLPAGLQMFPYGTSGCSPTEHHRGTGKQEPPP